MDERKERTKEWREEGKEGERKKKRKRAREEEEGRQRKGEGREGGEMKVVNINPITKQMS